MLRATRSEVLLTLGLATACGGGGGGDAGLDGPRPDAGPATAILFDDFEYVVDRDDPNGEATFVAHGWTDVKTQQAGDNARGFLYTVAAIPGYTGTFPGGGDRVLAMEALAGQYQVQTDFWLKYGTQDTSLETVPGNVWFQFWLYVNYYDDPDDLADQMSQIGNRDKFIYPCTGYYPCSAETGGNKWLFEVGAGLNGTFPNGLPSPGNLFISSRDNTIGDVNYSLAPAGDEFKLYQQDPVNHILPNTWTLVKLHWDTSSANGTWEAWITQRGQPTVKVAEWIGGVTPNFTWTLAPEHQGGHRQFAMPTTIPGANNNEFYDFWIYMDDFVMATGEAALPTYP